MRTGPALRQLVLKEARALLPIWLASGVAIVAGIVAGSPQFVGYVWRFVPVQPILRVAGTLGFVLGSLSLGAYSVGHEYAHHTLPALLAQPIQRGRLLAAKAIVLAGGLAALTLLAWALMRYGTVAGLLADQKLALLLLTPLVSVSVVPWLTLACRNTIAGVVFSLGIAAGFWIAAEVVNAATHGYQSIPADLSLNWAALWVGTASVSAVALVAAPWTFHRLENVDGPREIVPPRLLPRRALSTAGRTRQRPGWAELAYKESRLHDGAFMLAGLYVVAWGGIVLTRTDSAVLGSPFNAITTVYAWFIALIAGAVTTAEERGRGVLGSQLLQPISAWKPWLIKMLVAYAATVIMAVVLPVALERLHSLSDQVPIDWAQTKSLLALTTAAIYVSSVATGGLRALLWSLPLVTVGGALLSYSWVASSLATYRLLNVSTQFWRRFPGLTRTDVLWARSIDTQLSTAIASALIAALIWLAWRNYRSGEDAQTRLRRQLPWLAAATCAGGVVMGAVFPVLIRLLAF